LIGVFNEFLFKIIKAAEPIIINPPTITTTQIIIISVFDKPDELDFDDVGVWVGENVVTEIDICEYDDEESEVVTTVADDKVVDEP